MPQKASSIALNFFPLLKKDFFFQVYRKAMSSSEEKRPFDGCKLFKLPLEDNYYPHWVCYEQKEGFSKFICDSHTNNDLTKHYLSHLLTSQTKSLNSNDYSFDRDDFSERILFVIARHPQNRAEAVWLEPYFLKETKRLSQNLSGNHCYKLHRSV